MSDQPFVDFAGRRVILTGASSGIGRAIAVELARRGAGVVILGRDKERLAETAAQMPTPPVDVWHLDLADSSGVGEGVLQLARKHGRFYGLCHCAGLVETRPLSSLTASRLRELMEVNLTAGIELAKAVTRRDVCTEGEGSLVFLSSVYASVGMPGQISYSATKGAVLAAARTMAVELARRKIRVNTVSPGLVHTPLSDAALARLTDEHLKALEGAHPLGPGSPAEVARVVTFVLSPQNGWMTGTDVVIDGGFSAR
jgi:NAD(P)-dependent dehydrogenase (short-subunit alcohol dehydrogenase family)